MRRFFSSAFEWMNVQLIFLIQRELSICHGNFNDWKETHKKKKSFQRCPTYRLKNLGNPKEPQERESQKIKLFYI